MVTVATNMVMSVFISQRHGNSQYGVVVITETLEYWISWYNGVCWGWETGYNLSGNPKYNSIGGFI